MNDELCFQSATVLREKILRRELSPVEITRAVLDRAQRLQPQLNCFITICADEALAEAKAAEQSLMRGEQVGLLHGIPYTCKDLVNTRGVRTTFGSRLFEHNVPAQDAEAIARLRRQGAILVGKTTTSEFGAKCLTDAPLFGRTRNVWSPDHTSGGSSGGAAVALAASIAPIGIASDSGGSTRIPAACNGVVGLKQSNGLVPNSQVDDVFSNVTYVTPMARDVADTALMLQAMAGEDRSDPWSIGLVVPDYVQAAKAQGDLRGKRVLYCAAPEGRPISAEVAAAFNSTLARLRELGAELIEMAGDRFNIEPLWRTINHTVWRASFGEMAALHGDLMSPSLLQQLALVRDVSGVDYLRAMFERTQLFRHVQSLFDQNDLIAVPTLSRVALPIEQDLFGPIEIDGAVLPEVRPNWFPWTMPFNLTGHPAITLPCGFSSAGLPIGIQLVGRFRCETDLLRAAALLEASLGLADRRPDLP